MAEEIGIMESGVEALRVCRDGLQRRIIALRADLEAVERAIGLLSNGEAAAESPHDQTNSNAEYANLGVHAAAMTFLKANRGSKYTVKEITHEVVRRGVQTRSKNFPTTLGSALIRAHKKGLISKGRKSRRVAYFMENANEEGGGP